MAILNLQINASTDDAVELPTGGMLITNLTLQNSNINAFMGLRFNNITIPNGATINSATLIGEIYTTVRDSPAFNIHCEAVDNAVTFSSTSGDISGRTLTAAFVTITDADVGLGFYTFPDINSIIQDIINRPGWVSGNSIVIILDGITNGDSQFYSWDGSNQGEPFTLDLDYTSGGSQLIDTNTIINNNDIYVPVVTTLEVILLPNIVSDSDIIFDAVVSTNLVTLLPNMVNDTDVIYDPIISSGQVTVVTDFINNSSIIFVSIITTNDVTLLPNIINDSDNILSPVISTNEASIIPIMLINISTLLIPEISTDDITVSPNIVNDLDVFFLPTIIIEGSVIPEFILGSELIFIPTIYSGNVSLLPNIINDDDIFFIPTIFTGQNNILPNTLNDVDVVFIPTIGMDASNIPIIQQYTFIIEPDVTVFIIQPDITTYEVT